MGQTKNPASRYSGHKSRGALANVSSPVAVWTNRLVDAGVPPLYEIVAAVPAEAADEAELAEIRKHSASRPLLNVRGVVCHSEIPTRRVQARWITDAQQMRNGSLGRLHYYAELLECGHYRQGACHDVARLRRLRKKRRCTQCAGVPTE